MALLPDWWVSALLLLCVAEAAGVLGWWFDRGGL